jgi:sigma-B regulation protein RsbU (phosphoserine phosphatase)
METLIRQRYRREVRAGELAFVFAHNGREALEVLSRDASIEAVLTDINMPEMDGLSLLGALPQVNGRLKTVVVSAYGDIANIRAAMNRGAFDFVTKPIDFEDLDATIRKTRQEVVNLKRATRDRDRLAAIERELDTARGIQQALLPQRFPPFPQRSEFDIHAAMLPARSVGGDFYDFFFVGDDRLAFVIGDVAGKGIPAALYMAVSQTLSRAVGRTGADPATALARMNDTLCEQSRIDLFVTLFYGVLDVTSGRLTYASAGHNPPYHLPAGGRPPRALDIPEGLVLGVQCGGLYSNGELRLAPGDGLFLYTDGVTEAMAPGDVLFGEERLEAVLEAPFARPKEPVEAVTRAVLDFQATRPQHDDVTVMCVRMRD